jgi:hypothetical protein
MLMVTAQTQSLNSSLVNVLEGGAVKEIFAEDGQMLTKGQPIARVYNPNTEFNYLNQETGIMQQISQMRSSLLELKIRNSIRIKNYCSLRMIIIRRCRLLIFRKDCTMRKSERKPIMILLSKFELSERQKTNC